MWLAVFASGTGMTLWPRLDLELPSGRWRRVWQMYATALSP